MNQSFDDIRKQYNSSYYEIKKMNVQSLNLFSESHGLEVIINPIAEIGKAHKYIAYKYLEKLCALNALSMPSKWFKKVKDAEALYKGSTINIVRDKDPNKRGARAALIKRMLIAGATKDEIKMAVVERFPNVHLGNIGCQISATVCFLKRKELKDVNSDQKI